MKDIAIQVKELLIAMASLCSDKSVLATRRDTLAFQDYKLLPDRVPACFAIVSGG